MVPDDPRQPILSLLANYSNSYPLESETTARFQRFVRSHADCFERRLDLGHVTGSALIIDKACQRVLLTHHKKLDRWLQPGGHADGVPDVMKVAMTESEEESGLPALAFYSHDLLDVDIHEIPERKSEPTHFHYDCRFLIRAGGSDEFVISDESNDLAWVNMDEIEAYTTELSILRMITKARRLID
jgi:8-oxo-dGTP pyrophosphatase MutT (NUDIX family)